jgi:hypothetical protein
MPNEIIAIDTVDDYKFLLLGVILCQQGGPDDKK